MSNAPTSALRGVTVEAGSPGPRFRVQLYAVDDDGILAFYRAPPSYSRAISTRMASASKWS